MDVNEIIGKLPAKGSNGSGEYAKEKVYFSVFVGTKKGQEIKELKDAVKKSKKSLVMEIGDKRFTGDVSALVLLIPEVKEHVEKITQEISAIENLCSEEE